MGGSCLGRSSARLQDQAGERVAASLCQWPTLSPCGFVWGLRSLPQKQVHRQPSQGSLPYGGRNLERSLGLPAKVTHTGLTQRLWSYFFSQQDQACSSLGFGSPLPASTSMGKSKGCWAAEVVLLEVPPAAPAFALPSPATTRQGLNSSGAVQGAGVTRIVRSQLQPQLVDGRGPVPSSYNIPSFCCDLGQWVLIPRPHFPQKKEIQIHQRG